MNGIQRIRKLTVCVTNSDTARILGEVDTSHARMQQSLKQSKAKDK